MRDGIVFFLLRLGCRICDISSRRCFKWGISLL